MPIQVRKGQKIAWNWRLKSDNINFTATLKNGEKNVDKQIVKQDRIKMHQFEYEVEEDGELQLFFDNSFSWLSGKTIIGIVTIDK